MRRPVARRTYLRKFKKRNRLGLAICGFPDVSTRVHSFHKKRGRTVFSFSGPMYQANGFTLTSLARTRAVESAAFRAPSMGPGPRGRGLPESNQHFVSVWSQGVTVKKKRTNLVQNCKAAMHKRPCLTSCSRREPSTKVTARSTQLLSVTESAAESSDSEAEDRVSADLVGRGVHDGNGA